MLVRDDADHVGSPAGAAQRRVLAACPDSDDRGEACRWSVTLVPGETGAADGSSMEVATDDEHVTATAAVHRDGAVVDVARAAGDAVVIVATAGQCLVADTSGPWRRWLEPADVFVGEGETAEDLRLTLAPGTGEVTVVRLSPTGAAALRWVP